MATSEAQREYQKIWRARRKALAPEKPPKPTHAEHMVAYRLRLRAKQGLPPRVTKCPMVSDKTLESDIMRRGWELTEMMRTPPAMWKPEWLTE